LCVDLRNTIWIECVQGAQLINHFNLLGYRLNIRVFSIYQRSIGRSSSQQHDIPKIVKSTRPPTHQAEGLHFIVFDPSKHTQLGMLYAI
jgi:hypothetical protein